MLLIRFESKKFVQTGYAAFFLIKIWMYIQIERCRNIRVSEYYTYGFIVASAFNASGGKCVAQSMEHDSRDSKSCENPAESLPVCTGFFRFGALADPILFYSLLFFHYIQGFEEKRRYRDFTI